MVAAFGGAFLWEVSPQANFIGAFGFGLLGTIYYALRGSDERSLQPVLNSGRSRPT